MRLWLLLLAFLFLVLALNLGANYVGRRIQKFVKGRVMYCD